MGWLNNDDGTHEGFLAVEFADGHRASTGNRLGPVVTLFDDLGTMLGRQQRRDGDVIGWRVCCECWPGQSWVGPMFAKVEHAAEQDLDAGRIHLPAGESPMVVPNREDVRQAAIAAWRAGHIAATSTLTVIRDARAQMAAAQSRMDDAAALARLTGNSWHEISQAAGVDAEEAERRWGALGVSDSVG